MGVRPQRSAAAVQPVPVGHGPAGSRMAALVEVRAALAAGASPAAALQAACGDPALSSPAAALRVGATVADIASDIDTGEPAVDLLVRALGVAERSGGSGLDAVEQALAAVQEEDDLQRMLRARTAQARGTARLLAWLPLVAWVLVGIADPAVLGYLRTAPGRVTTVVAVLLTAAAQRWSSRIVRRAACAAASADPLRAAPAPWHWGRATAVAGPAFLVLLVGVGAGAATAAAGLLAVLAARPRAPSLAGFSDAGRASDAAVRQSGGGATETVELIVIALRSGLSAPAAIATVAPLAPPVARRALDTATRRLHGGWDPAAALQGTGLDAVGSVLDASARWGAPAGPALARLAADLRRDRRSLAEEAAERSQLQLVFPTTLLTLPAFLLGIVPPLLWVAFGNARSPMHLP